MAESRVERKERTRRAILDAALSLCEDSSLVALCLLCTSDAADE